jgi:type IV pilus modification protein PilV
MTNARGFTIVEVLIAVIVLSIGLLGLFGTSALVTRMVGRGQRSANAANFAMQRIERLRANACAARSAGSDTLYRSGNWVAINSWTWTSLSNSGWKIALALTYKTAPGKTRTESMETEVSCVS